MEQPQRSWLSLVTFCAVTGLIAALGSAFLLAGASLAFAVARPAPGADANALVEAFSAQTVGPPAVEPSEVEPQNTSQTIDDSGATSGQTFAGMITDSRCGARHRMNSGKTSAECARSCVRHGAHYVLVDGEKTYALEGDPTQLETLAGERVKVVGMLEGDTIKVKTVIAG